MIINTDKEFFNFVADESLPDESLQELEVSDIDYLPVETWKDFFNKLSQCTNLQKLQLKHANFEMSEHGYLILCAYLKQNTALLEIGIFPNDSQPLVNFEEGFYAEKLLEALQKNTHLVSFKYGSGFSLSSADNVLSLSLKIQSKLLDNKTLPVKITKALGSFKKDNYLSEKMDEFDNWVKKSIAMPSEKTSEQTLARYLKTLKSELSDLNTKLSLARQNNDFKDSDMDKNFTKMYDYYSSQKDLIVALNNIKQQVKKASPHDSIILLKFANNQLKKWQNILNVEDKKERNVQLNTFFESMKKECNEVSQKVTDETGNALIKNILLIVSAILTLGVSLGIYAAATKQARAKQGSGFFFKNNEPSKDVVGKAEDMAEKAKSEQEQYKLN